MTINPMVLKLRMKKLGVLLRDARLKKGKSLQETAGVMGVSEEIIQAYEDGETSPSLPELENFAYFLDVPVEQFWSDRVLPEQVNQPLANPKEFLAIRQRIIGILLHQARLRAGVSLPDLAGRCEVPAEQLEAFELGEAAIPLPVLEVLCKQLNCSLNLFFTQQGRVGEWLAQHNEHKVLETLPPEVRKFISNPDQNAFIVVAKYLSELPPEKLEPLAQYLLLAVHNMKLPA